MNEYEVTVVSYHNYNDHVVEIETFHTTMMEEDIEKQIEETIDRINPFYDEGHKRWSNHGIKRDNVVVEKKVMYHYDGWGRTIGYLSNSDKKEEENKSDEVWVVMVVGQYDYADCTELVGLYSNEADALTRSTKTWEELEAVCYDSGEELSDLLQILVYKHPVVEGIA